MSYSETNQYQSCKKCFRPFIRKGRQIYCEISCKPRKPIIPKVRAQNIYGERECSRDGCPNVFQMKAKNQLYCSKSCWIQAYHGPDVPSKTLRCIGCWREFKVPHGNLSYCNNKCKKIGQTYVKERNRPNARQYPSFYGFQPRDVIEFREWFRESYLQFGFHNLSRVFPCFDSSEWKPEYRARFHYLACYQSQFDYTPPKAPVVRSIWHYTAGEPRVYQLSPWFVWFVDSVLHSEPDSEKLHRLYTGSMV